MLQKTVEKLIHLDSLNWREYILSRDPLYKKMSIQEKQAILESSIGCAEKQLVKWKNLCMNVSLEEVLSSKGIKLFYNESPLIKEFMYFALYKPGSSTIELSVKAIERVNKVIDDNNLGVLLDKVNLEQLILAHEFYHYIELTEQLDTTQVYIQSPTFSGLVKKRRVRSASEIGAVYFSRQWLGLNYCPAIFDILLIYVDDSNRAFELSRKLLRKGGEK